MSNEQRNIANTNLDAWQTSLMGNLAFAIKQTQDELNSVVTEGSINRLAWLARNLLELAIWNGYCCYSKENARQFYLDCCRDSRGLLTALRRFAAAHRHVSLKFDNVEQEMKDFSEFSELDPEDENYTKIQQAAKTLNREKWFAPCCRILSKLAHPSALSIMTVNTLPKAESELIRKSLHRMGNLFVLEALKYQSIFLKEDGYSAEVAKLEAQYGKLIA